MLVHRCVCICTYMCARMAALYCVHMSMCGCICVHKRMHVQGLCMPEHVRCMCTRVCMYTRVLQGITVVQVCMHVLCECVHVCLAHAWSVVHVCTQPHMCMYVACAPLWTRVHTSMCVCVRVYMSTCVCGCAGRQCSRSGSAVCHLGGRLLPPLLPTRQPRQAHCLTSPGLSHTFVCTVPLVFHILPGLTSRRQPAG